MIAKCLMCRELITPDSIVGIKEPQLHKLPPDQQTVVLLSNAISRHVREHHPQYLATVMQLAQTAIAHGMLATVETAGQNIHTFNCKLAADAARLRLYWEALPNSPHPDTIAELDRQTQHAVMLAQQLDAGIGPGAVSS